MTKMTRRQAQVVALVAEGKSNPEIGAALGLTVGTVKEYLHRIFTKLEVSNRTALAIWAMKHRNEAL